MNFNQLRFVCSVAALKSFSAAATSCSVTQPTLSNGVAQLEDELGHKIFDRTTRKVSLTAFGTLILPDLQQILNIKDEVLKKASTFLDPDEHVIRIGITPLLDLQFLDALLKPYHSQQPETKMIFHEQYMDDLYRMLDQGEIDFMFGVTELQKVDRKTAFLYYEPLQFIPRGGTHFSRNIVSFDDIADETFVLVPDACGLTRTIRKLFETNNRQLHEYPGEAMSYQMLEQWAKRGLGATILPRSKIIDKELAHVDILDCTSKEMLVGFDAVWNIYCNTKGAKASFAHYLEKIVPTLSIQP